MHLDHIGKQSCGKNGNKYRQNVHDMRRTVEQEMRSPAMN